MFKPELMPDFGARRIFFAFLLSTCLLSANAFSFELQDYLRTRFSKTKNNEDFLVHFPYQKYLEENNLSDLDQLEKDRLALNAFGLDGDQFLYTLTQGFIKNNPLKNQSIRLFEQRFQLAEAFLRQKETMIFEVIAYALMEDLARNLDRGLKASNLDKHQPALQNLIKNLAAHQFIVNIPMSNTEKLRYHILQGDWSYILDRFLKEFFWDSYWLFGIFCCLMITTLMYLPRFIRLNLRYFFQLLPKADRNMSS